MANTERQWYGDFGGIRWKVIRTETEPAKTKQVEYSTLQQAQQWLLHIASFQSFVQYST